jgi:hypothetical protein
MVVFSGPHRVANVASTKGFTRSTICAAKAMPPPDGPMKFGSSSGVSSRTREGSSWSMATMMCGSMSPSATSASIAVSALYPSLVNTQAPSVKYTTGSRVEPS